MMTLELFEKARPALWDYAMRLTRKKCVAEELIQETFLRAWRFRVQFEGDNPAGWLSRIMRNIHIAGRIRRKSVDAANVNDLAAVIHVREAEGKLTVHENEGYNEVLAEQALRRLTPTESHILYCAGIQQQKYTDIADSMGLSEQAVKTRIHRARAKLAAVI